MCLPKFVTGFVYIYATEVWMLLLGRALVGIADAGIFTILPMYASEIASKEIRGSLGTILQIMCSFGVVTMPEFEKADEMNTESVSKKDIIKNRMFLKSLTLVLILGLGSQFVGFNAVSFYLQTVLESTQTSVRPEIASVTIGLIQLFASFCTTLVTDRFGRKPILSVTCVGMGLGMLGLGLFFKLKENGAVDGFMNYVPLISLILVVFCYSAGIGSLMWVLNAELFDGPSRGLGMSISLIVTTLFVFLTTKYFAIVSLSIGPAVTYWIFSINCILLCAFIIFCVPETKGRSFAEIQDILRGKKDEDTKC